MAHLLEHMLFKGTHEAPGHHEGAQRRTARSSTASTSCDRTNYFETFDASDENLEWALDLEADRMVNSLVAKKDLDSEMTVVRNEFESGENSPTRVLFERVLARGVRLAQLRQVHRSAARSDIENVPIERLQAFYRSVLPARQRGAGRRRTVRRGEGARPDRARLRRDPEADARAAGDATPSSPCRTASATVTCAASATSQIVMVAYHVPAGAHPDFAPLACSRRACSATTPSGRLLQGARRARRPRVGRRREHAPAARSRRS